MSFTYNSSTNFHPSILLVHVIIYIRKEGVSYEDRKNARQETDSPPQLEPGHEIQC